MEASKEGVQDELKHQYNLIDVMKKRRRELETQMASFGTLYTPPHITREIIELSEQIILREQEIAQLETKAVQGEVSLAEAEYQTLVAEAWSRSSGWLSVADRARLELNRLRLRVAQVDSDKHHNTVRSELAKEVLLDLELNDIQGNPEIRSRAVQRIIRAFRFDSVSTEKTLRLNIDRKSTEVLAEWISITRTVWDSEKEFQDLKSMFERVLHHKQDNQLSLERIGKLPQQWTGHYTYDNGRGSIPMTLYIDRVEGENIQARFEWQGTHHTITRASGHVKYNLTNDAEARKWQHISQSLVSTNVIGIKLTEEGYIQGAGTQLYGWYYGIIQENRTMIGVWFSSQKASHSEATFNLQLHS